MASDHLPDGYTNAEDGTIWLTCTCGWRTNLGPGPTPAEAVKAWTEHERGAVR